ncbi:MAG: acyl-CoA dehydrogenase family protein [Deltaproteobacteria bacterium]|nr:MAG: acyl-CoA dehydrogenase family protein [Deltaproteobacteria bacterium]
MNLDSFLANIYFGSLDLERLYSFKDPEEDEKTRKIINKFLELNKKYPPAYLEREGVVPAELLDELKKIGFFGLNIPEEYGGVGLNLWQYQRVAEEMASQDMALALIALAHLSIGAKGILLFGNEKQKKKYLIPAAAGEMIFSYALTEPKTGSDAKNIQTAAVLSKDGSHYILNGQKTYITNANYAGGLTVFAQMDPENPGFMGAFIVETDWEGVNIGKDMPKMGLTASSTAAIQFKEVRVPKENLLGQPGDGFKIAMSILNYGRVGLGAASAGIMYRSLQDMVKRASSRRQFGVPIRNFELVQEKIVRARVHSYVTSAMAKFAVGMLMDNPLAAVAVESSHCKLYGTTRGWDTLYDALQVAGGSGYLATQPYEKRMRDFRVTTIFEGTTEIHSIYPPLFVMRSLRKKMKAVCSGKISELAFLLKGMFRRADWKPRFKHRVMNRAVRLARANARRIRWMIHAGLLFYGRKIQDKQFFLRRITNLSLYLYGIISLVARVEAAERMGRDVSEDLALLGYFLEEARQSKKRDKRFFSSRQEALHKKVFSDVIS